MDTVLLGICNINICLVMVASNEQKFPIFVKSNVYVYVFFCGNCFLCSFLEILVYSEVMKKLSCYLSEALPYLSLKIYASSD